MLFDSQIIQNDPTNFTCISEFQNIFDGINTIRNLEFNN